MKGDPRCTNRSVRSEQFVGSYAVRPVQSVEATSTSWSFEQTWHLSLAPCLLAVHSATVPEDSMKILDEFFGCEETGTRNARSMLYPLLHSIKTSRARATQKRNALHMMALSGVIRPSHIELRYGTPLTSLPALWQSATTKTPLTIEHASRSTRLHEIQAGSKQFWQWIRSH